MDVSGMTSCTNAAQTALQDQIMQLLLEQEELDAANAVQAAAQQANAGDLNGMNTNTQAPTPDHTSMSS